MKVFYAELAANPAYYSFGYSVYARVEPEDDLAECYQQGFLPFVGVQDDPGPLLYMARGSRVLVPSFVERTYHTRLDRKVAAQFPGGVTVLVHEREQFIVTPEFTSFVLSYFRFRFGKDAMPQERLAAILASPLLTHISEYRADGKPIAYILEVQGSTFVHAWYATYAKSAAGTHLGAYLFLDFIRRARAAGKTYTYLGVTYGPWMRYKTNFEPLEFWDGREWVTDPKSHLLKRLLPLDPLRTIVFTDRWRESLRPYYSAPYRFESTRAEYRFLTLILAGMPRLALVVLGSIALLLATLFVMIVLPH